MFFLIEYTHIPTFGASQVTSNTFKKSGVVGHALMLAFLYFFKSLCCCLGPSKLLFLHTINDKRHNGTEISEEALVKC